jgi:hypothetical protein
MTRRAFLKVLLLGLAILQSTPANVEDAAGGMPMPLILGHTVTGRGVWY